MGSAYDVAVRGLGLAIVAAVLLALQCAAQAPSGSGCMPELVSLSPCMDYLSGNETTPDGPCCTALSGMLRSSPSCLCMVLGGTAASLGVSIDGARALQMPGACKVQALPASQCNAVTSPAAGTTAPGAPTAAAQPDANVTPGGSGSKATPAPTLPYSNGNNVRPGAIFVFVAAALALLHCF